MADEKTIKARIQEGYNARPLCQAFNEIVQKGYNGQPLAQTFAQLTQGSAPGSGPASQGSPAPSAPLPASSGGRD